MNCASTFLRTPFLQNATGGCSCKSLQLYQHKTSPRVFFVNFVKFFGTCFDALLEFSKKIFAKYLSPDRCFVKTNTINCDDNDDDDMRFPNTRAFAFSR